MKQGCSSWLILAAIAACGSPAAAGPAAPAPVAVPKPSPAALSARPVAWSKRGPAVALPASAKHLQLIITPGWAKDERFAWVIADGNDVVVVHRTTSDDLGDYIEAIARSIYAKPGSSLDRRSVTVMGAYKPPPPPPPPDPGGGPRPFPRIYVETLLQAAFNVNREAIRAVAHLDAGAIGE